MVLVLVAVAVDREEEVLEGIVVPDWFVEEDSLLLLLLVVRGDTDDVDEIIDDTEFGIVVGVLVADNGDRLVGEQDLAVLMLLIKLLVLTLFRQLLSAELLRIRLVTVFCPLEAERTLWLRELVVEMLFALFATAAAAAALRALLLIVAMAQPPKLIVVVVG